LNRLGHAADFHLQRQIDILPKTDRDVRLLDRLEPGELRANDVGAGCQKWHTESALGVGYRSFRTLRSRYRDGHARHRQPLCVVDAPGDRTGGPLRERGHRPGERCHENEKEECRYTEPSITCHVVRSYVVPVSFMKRFDSSMHRATQVTPKRWNHLPMILRATFVNWIEYKRSRFRLIENPNFKMGRPETVPLCVLKRSSLR
jgi:hypothetical protein